MKFRDILNSTWSLKSIIVVATLLIIFTLLAFLYINSPSYFSFRFPTVDERVQMSVDSTLERNLNFAAIQVVKADLRENTRYIEYTAIRGVELNRLYNSFVTNRITKEVPVFTGKENQDSKIVAIINHEFICYPFKDTLSYEFVPEMAKYITTVCSTAIPAYSGKFTGFIAVFLKNEPNQTEKDIIRIESIKLSTEVYNQTK